MRIAFPLYNISFRSSLLFTVFFSLQNRLNRLAQRRIAPDLRVENNAENCSITHHAVST